MPKPTDQNNNKPVAPTAASVQEFLSRVQFVMLPNGSISFGLSNADASPTSHDTKQPTNTLTYAECEELYFRENQNKLEDYQKAAAGFKQIFDSNRKEFPVFCAYLAALLATDLNDDKRTALREINAFIRDYSKSTDRELLFQLNRIAYQIEVELKEVEAARKRSEALRLVDHDFLFINTDKKPAKVLAEISVFISAPTIVPVQKKWFAGPLAANSFYARSSQIAVAIAEIQKEGDPLPIEKKDAYQQEVLKLKKLADEGYLLAEWFHTKLLLTNISKLKKSKQLKLAALVITRLKAFANAGYVRAQYELSNIYAGGPTSLLDGLINPDMAKSVEMLMQAVENGYPEAQFLAAVLMGGKNNERGVTFQPDKAFDYLLRAVENHQHVGASYLLGIMIIAVRYENQFCSALLITQHLIQEKSIVERLKKFTLEETVKLFEQGKAYNSAEAEKILKILGQLSSDKKSEPPATTLQSSQANQSEAAGVVPSSLARPSFDFKTAHTPPAKVPPVETQLEGKTDASATVTASKSTLPADTKNATPTFEEGEAYYLSTPPDYVKAASYFKSFYESNRNVQAHFGYIASLLATETEANKVLALQKIKDFFKDYPEVIKLKEKIELKKIAHQIAVELDRKEEAKELAKELLPIFPDLFLFNPNKDKKHASAKVLAEIAVALYYKNFYEQNNWLQGDAQKCQDGRLMSINLRITHIKSNNLSDPYKNAALQPSYDLLKILADEGYLPAKSTYASYLFEKKQTQSGMEYLKAAAEGGQSKAQWMLACVYAHQIPDPSLRANIKKDLHKTKYWLMKAAENHNPDAQFRLATIIGNKSMCHKDSTYVFDPIKAVELLQAAAENHEHSSACFYLGAMILALYPDRNDVSFIHFFTSLVHEHESVRMKLKKYSFEDGEIFLTKGKDSDQSVLPLGNQSQAGGSKFNEAKSTPTAVKEKSKIEGTARSSFSEGKQHFMASRFKEASSAKTEIKEAQASVAAGSENAAVAAAQSDNKKKKKKKKRKKNGKPKVDLTPARSEEEKRDALLKKLAKQEERAAAEKVAAEKAAAEKAAAEKAAAEKAAAEKAAAEKAAAEKAAAEKVAADKAAAEKVAAEKAAAEKAAAEKAAAEKVAADKAAAEKAAAEKAAAERAAAAKAAAAKAAAERAAAKAAAERAAAKAAAVKAAAVKAAAEKAAAEKAAAAKAAAEKAAAEKVAAEKAATEKAAAEKVAAEKAAAEKATAEKTAPQAVDEQLKTIHREREKLNAMLASMAKREAELIAEVKRQAGHTAATLAPKEKVQAPQTEKEILLAKAQEALRHGSRFQELLKSTLSPEERIVAIEAEIRSFDSNMHFASLKSDFVHKYQRLIDEITAAHPNMTDAKQVPGRLQTPSQFRDVPSAQSMPQNVKVRHTAMGQGSNFFQPPRPTVPSRPLYQPQIPPALPPQPVMQLPQTAVPSPQPVYQHQMPLVLQPQPMMQPPQAAVPSPQPVYQHQMPLVLQPQPMMQPPQAAVPSPRPVYQHQMPLVLQPQPMMQPPQTAVSSPQPVYQQQNPQAVQSQMNAGPRYVLFSGNYYDRQTGLTIVPLPTPNTFSSLLQNSQVQQNVATPAPSLSSQPWTPGGKRR